MSRWGRLSPFSAPFLPFYLLYRFGWWLRYGWKRRFGRVYRPAARVISIGNVEWGGTGKTTLAAEVARELSATGRKVAILSRGYGRSGRAVERVDPSEPEAWRRYGDEPVWLARQLAGVDVWVGADRAEVARKAELGAKYDVLILDDALQNFSIAKDLNLVLIDPDVVDRPPVWLNDLFLRAPRALLRDADAVIHLGSAPGSKSGPEFQVSYKPHGFVPLLESLGLPATRPSPPVTLPSPIVASCGIAKPQRFLEMLRSAGIEPVVFRAFPDHHPYSDADLSELAGLARREQAHGIVITGKDAVKWSGRWNHPDLPVFVAKVQLEWAAGREKFGRLLRGLWQG